VLDFVINQVFVEYTDGKVEEGYMNRAMDEYDGREKGLAPAAERTTERGGGN
jgi:hypothetical protein